MTVLESQLILRSGNCLIKTLSPDTFVESIIYEDNAIHAKYNLHRLFKFTCATIYFAEPNGYVP